MTPLDPPDGFALRRCNRLSPDTLRRRPVTEWSGELRRLLEAGAEDAWLDVQAAGFGQAAGIVAGLHDRGAILIAERGRTKRYRLTAYGVRLARQSYR